VTRATAIPIVALWLALPLLGPGCPPKPVDDTVKPRRVKTLSKGVIRVRIPADLPQMPCLLRNHTWCDRILWHTVYEPLVRYDVAQKRFVGVLATSWKYLDGGRTFQMELRRKVRWHNGRELKSRDVKHSLDRLRNQSTFSGHPAVRLLRLHVEGFSYPTDHLFEIKFKKPFGPILEVLSALPDADKP
jgi:ABC-type transport system substrate-binding protein